MVRNLCETAKVEHGITVTALALNDCVSILIEEKVEDFVRACFESCSLAELIEVQKMVAKGEKKKAPKQQTEPANGH